VTPDEAKLLALIVRERQKARTARIRAVLAVAMLAPDDAELAAALTSEAAAGLEVTAALRALRDRLRGRRARAAA